MTYAEELEQHKADTLEIIQALLSDGSDPSALYQIEHHFSAESLEELEPAMQAIFNKGYEVYAPEEIELEDGSTIFSFDAVMESALLAERIFAQLEFVIQFAEQHKISYDGWGTYFESDEEEFDEFDDEDDEESMPGENPQKTAPFKH